MKQNYSGYEGRLVSERSRVQILVTNTINGSIFTFVCCKIVPMDVWKG